MNFFRVFQHLLPTGQAFRVVIDKVLRRFFAGLAEALPTAARAFADLAFLDLFPAYTRHLREWEKFYGLTPSGDDSEESRRLALAGEWAATGGQSPSYIQGVLQAAGFQIFIHEWWASGPPWVARDPRSYADLPLIGTVQCGESLAACGEESAQCDSFLVNEPGYWKTQNLSLRAPPVIPSDPNAWPYFLYFGAATFPDRAIVPLARKLELQRLIEKLKPAQNWIVNRVSYIGEDPISQMFAAGEKGFCFDFTDAATLFQDAARTVPVTTNGQPIGGAADLSPNAAHATAGTTTTRPSWSSGGALFDGSNDFLQTPSIDLTACPEVTVFCRYELLSASVAIVYESSTDVNANHGAIAHAVNSGGTNRRAFNQRQVTPSSLPQEGYFTATGFLETILKATFPAANYAAGLTVKVDGVSQALTQTVTGNITATTRGNYPWFIGARAGTSLFANIRMTRLLVIGRALTAEETLYLESL